MELDTDTLSTLRLASVLGILGLLLALEWRHPFRTPGQPTVRHAAMNLTIAGSNAVLVNLLFGGWLLFLSHRVASESWGLLPQLGLSPLSLIVASVVLLDLTFYGVHRANHDLSWLWRFHRAHHSDLDLDVTSAFRFHLGEVLMSTGIKALTIPILGIPPAGLLLFDTLLVASAEFQHSNVRLPASVDGTLRRVIVTPHMHWIHHSRETTHHNSNFGTILSMWDRMFGTGSFDVRRQDVRIGLDQYSSPESVSFRAFLAMPLGPAPDRQG